MVKLMDVSQHVLLSATVFFNSEHRIMTNKIFLFCIAIFLSSSNLWCDIVHLKNGNKIRGNIIFKNKEKVIVKMAFGKITISAKEIRKVVKESLTRTIIAQSNRLISLGADRQGIIHLKRAIRKRPEKNRLKKGLANLYFKLGKKYILHNPTNALHFLEKAKKIDTSIDILPYSTQIQEQRILATDTKKQADLLLQTQSYKKALEIYQKALDINPDLHANISKAMSICASQLGHEQFKQKQYSLALNFYTLALKQDPEVFPYIEQAWLYSKTEVISELQFKTNNWQAALLELQNILEIRPDYRRALLMTGFSLEKLKDYQRAFNYYNEIIGSKKKWDGKFASLELVRTTAESKTNSNINLRPFFVPKNSRMKEWGKLKTPHFIIYYQDRELAGKIGNTFEYQWYSIQQKLGPKKNDRKWTTCEVYVFPSRREYMKNTGLPEWSDGVTKMAYQQGRLYEQKIYLYASAPLLLSNIIPHELTHAMYPWFLNYRHRLPKWLNEGIAMTSEAKFRSSNRQYTLKRAIKRGTLIPLSKLLKMKAYPSSEEQVHIFYAQSLSLVTFLIKQKGINGLLKLTQKTSNIKSVLKDVYKMSSISALERKWLNYAKSS